MFVSRKRMREAEHRIIELKHFTSNLEDRLTYLARTYRNLLSRVSELSPSDKWDGIDLINTFLPRDGKND